MIEKVTEFIHNAGTWLAGIFMLAGSLFEAIQALHQAFPAAAWLSGALAVVGGIVTLGQSLGYNKRQAIEAAADAHVQAAQIAAGSTVVPATSSPK